MTVATANGGALDEVVAQCRQLLPDDAVAPPDGEAHTVEVLDTSTRGLPARHTLTPG